MNKISAVYKITNTVTGDFYIGSSNDVKRRWKEHKCPSYLKNYPNNQLYQDMRKYGLDKFDFQVLEEVEESFLKEAEQKFIELLKPTYNSIRANGWDIERYKETKKEYQKSDKGKESQKEYQKTEKGKKSRKKANNKYQNQLCCYNGETLTLGALRMRFKRKGIEHPIQEAKKYLLEQSI